MQFRPIVRVQTPKTGSTKQIAPMCWGKQLSRSAVTTAAVLCELHWRVEGNWPSSLWLRGRGGCVKEGQRSFLVVDRGECICGSLAQVCVYIHTICVLVRACACVLHARMGACMVFACIVPCACVSVCCVSARACVCAPGCVCVCVRVHVCQGLFARVHSRQRTCGCRPGVRACPARTRACGRACARSRARGGGGCVGAWAHLSTWPRLMQGYFLPVAWRLCVCGCVCACACACVRMAHADDSVGCSCA